MKSHLLSIFVLAIIPASALATTEQKYTLPELPYAANALEPVVDAETMSIHHGKHHNGYVTNLNKAVAADPNLQDKSLEDLLAMVGRLPEGVRNNAGGHWNHSFFWTSMSPIDKPSNPSADLLSAIQNSFGSIEGLKEAYNKAGAARFGSGWVWLIVGEDGELAITSTPNQDNPLMDLAAVKGTPILGNDVWEHAYYLNYQNRRSEYLENWWQVVNWQAVSERYASALDE